MCVKSPDARFHTADTRTQPSPSRQRRLGSRSTDSGRQEDGGEHLLAKMKEKNRSAQRRYRERIKARCPPRRCTVAFGARTAASPGCAVSWSALCCHSSGVSQTLKRHV